MPTVTLHLPSNPQGSLLKTPAKELPPKGPAALPELAPAHESDDSLKGHAILPKTATKNMKTDPESDPAPEQEVADELGTPSCTETRAKKNKRLEKKKIRDEDAGKN